MVAASEKEFVVFRRIPERGEIFDLFRRVTEKIRREALFKSR